jgi:hypothetical protein
MYNAKGEKLLGAWPGTKMEKDGTGLLAIIFQYHTRLMA